MRLLPPQATLPDRHATVHRSEFVGQVSGNNGQADCYRLFRPAYDRPHRDRRHYHFVIELLDHVPVGSKTQRIEQRQMSDQK